MSGKTIPEPPSAEAERRAALAGEVSSLGRVSAAARAGSDMNAAMLEKRRKDRV